MEIVCPSYINYQNSRLQTTKMKSMNIIPLIYALESEVPKMLYCQPITQQYMNEILLKSTSDFCVNRSYHVPTTNRHFAVSKDKWDRKEDTGN